jgi:hypothetical protein
MEEFAVINFLGKLHLCSQNICLEDKIFFYLDQSKERMLIGHVENIDKESGIVSVKIKYDEFTQKTFNQSFKIYEVDINNCYYPIIEIFNNFEGQKEITKINRDQLEFKTICPHCFKNSRELEDCQTPKENCKKLNKKSYAFIII